MSGILFNFEEIKSSRLSSLSIPPKSSNGFSPGLVIFTNKNIIQSLSSIDNEKGKFDFINSNYFVNNIINHFYILFNPKRNICLLSSNLAKNLKYILHVLFSSLPNNTILCVNIDIYNNNFLEDINIFVSNGFNSPFISSISPLYKEISPSVILTRLNIHNDPHASSVTLNKVLHSIQEFNTDNTSCYLFASLSKNAVNFLKKASHIGFIKQNGKISQRELTGELHVEDVKRKNNKFIYIIDIIKKSIKSGEEEEVSVEPTRYNFHSHPREAYIRHSVKKAWPSVTDYLGYHSLGENTIFHCVATIEGVYILSFGPYWANRLKKVSRRFINKKYDIDHKKHYTPIQYVEKINKIKYKNYPIYEVRFFPWNKATKTFKVFYPQIGSTCLQTRQSLEKYRKIY